MEGVRRAVLWTLKSTPRSQASARDAGAESSAELRAESPHTPTITRIPSFPGSASQGAARDTCPDSGLRAKRGSPLPDLVCVPRGASPPKSLRTTAPRGSVRLSPHVRPSDSPTPRELSMCEKGLSISDRESSVSERDLSINERDLSISEGSSSMAKRPLNMDQRPLNMDQRPSSVERPSSVGLGQWSPGGSTGRQPLGQAAARRVSAYGVASSAYGAASGRTARQRGVPGDRRVFVCARKRPLSRREHAAGATDCVAVEGGRRVVVAAERTRLDGMTRYVDEQPFAFDAAFGDGASNADVYAACVAPLVAACVRPGADARGTVLAYGQTGSGKTHTMFGGGSTDAGVVLCAADAFMAHGAATLAFYEIYQGQLRDLLADGRRLTPCEGADGRVSILGLAPVPVADAPGVRAAIARGLEARRQGATGANAASSRSHAVLQLVRARAVLTFVDLAGSERGADRSDVDRRTRLEGSEINRSLLALKECIRALDTDAAHTPFRQSKLTLVLKDAIAGGDSVRTAMIATVSPSGACFEHTLNTLRYAERFLDVGGGDVRASDTPDACMADASATSVVGDFETLPQHSSEPRPGAPNAARRIDLALPDAISSAAAQTVTSVSSPRHRVDAARTRVAHAVAEIQRLASASRDADILELLAEEVQSLLSAFRSLS